MLEFEQVAAFAVASCDKCAQQLQDWASIRLGQTASPPKLAIRRIVLRDDVSNQEKFHDFCGYLLEKQRGGLVTLPSATRKPSQLFLVPGSPLILQQLQVPSPGRECLLANQKV